MCTPTYANIDESNESGMNFNLFVELRRIPPMVIAIWHGNSKPNVNEYLDEFVNELLRIIPHGIIVNQHHIKIALGVIVCDTPARCMIKGDYPYQ